MRIALTFEVPCSIESAWRALHDPVSVSRLYGPLLGMVPLGPVPERFSSGDRVVVSLRAMTLIPLGRQAIAVVDTITQVDGVETRSMQDTGGPLSGPLAPLTNWHHTMALSPVAGSPGRTQWSDTLEVGGSLAFLYWPALYGTWRIRVARIKKLAREW